MINYLKYVNMDCDSALRVMNIEKETISDGVGLRLSIYLSGCDFSCEGCHNPQSWDYYNGKVLDKKMFNEIVSAYNENPLLNGITISGGDPFYKVEALTLFIKAIKDIIGCNIWVYTGNVFENIKDFDVIKDIDVIVDGPFVKALYKPNLVFKGSENQRIIDVKKSLEKKGVVTMIE